jgi:sec-independent protein translocase protein TatA
MGLDNPIHLAILLMILLLVFGAKRLPEMGRSLGSGLRGFKEAINGDTSVDQLKVAATATTEAPVADLEPVTTPATAHTPDAA